VQAEKRMAASLGAPENATLFGGHWYLILPTKVSWPEARLMCQLMGGHLACIESNEEWKFALALAGAQTLWLGGTDEDHEGKWTWINGSPWSFSAWAPGQPDNFGDGQDYLLFRSTGWDDLGKGGGITEALCEWE